jgi:hypothetical protein
MKRTHLVAFGAAALFAGGCQVGKGVGAASGYIYELGCSGKGDYCSEGVCGTDKNMAPFDLHPTYFAGEPIDDLRNYNSAGTGIMNNRLTIRLQRSGKQIELNDVLTFDVGSSYEVARCVRGRIDASGERDWNEANCYRASDDGPGRLRVQYDSDVHAALTLNATCTANLVASAVSSPVPNPDPTAVGAPVDPAQWLSWVEFQEFGGAAENDLLPGERHEISPKFRIDFGQRIYATSFKLTLVDDSVVNAAIDDRPSPVSQIGGILGGDPTTGRFDFDLQRGQGAQFFP